MRDFAVLPFSDRWSIVWNRDASVKLAAAEHIDGGNKTRLTHSANFQTLKTIEDGSVKGLPEPSVPEVTREKLGFRALEYGSEATEA